MNFSAVIFAVPKPKCATRASKYGCCWDNKTEAKSYAGEGCPGKETEKDDDAFCLILLLLLLIVVVVVVVVVVVLDVFSN